jgi:transcription-repair coupling factor (superfamily II helicase)
VKEIQIDTDFELLFPDHYINNVTERLSLYNKLSTIEDENTLLNYEKELSDRFGELPKEALDLLDSVRVKWLAKAYGIERIVMKQQKLIGYFVADQTSDYYQSAVFSNILQFVQSNTRSCRIKEKQTKNGLRLLLTFDRVTSIKIALEYLQKIKP